MADKVNLNNASKEDLMQLQGMNEETAEKLISYREENGEFKSIDDLNNVEGFQELMTDDLMNSVCLDC